MSHRLHQADGISCSWLLELSETAVEVMQEVLPPDFLLLFCQPEGITGEMPPCPGSVSPGLFLFFKCKYRTLKNTDLFQAQLQKQYCSQKTGCYLESWSQTNGNSSLKGRREMGRAVAKTQNCMFSAERMQLYGGYAPLLAVARLERLTNSSCH